MKARPELLLVDDDPTVLHALNKILKGHAGVRAATSGDQAIDLLRERPADLLLLDLEMPGLSGFDLIDHLKHSHELSHIPIVVLSAHDEQDVEARVLESGAADFLAKPFVPSQVLARVRAQLQLRRIQEMAAQTLPTKPEDSTPTILLVDDDVQFLHANRLALNALGCRLQFATSAKEALRSIEQSTPDLILLDVQLPDKSGFEVCELLQADPLLHFIPVIILTRFDDEESEARACDLGVMDFVSKACSPAVLVARVRKALRLRNDSDAMLVVMNRHWRQQSESRTALMVDAASDGILSVDPEGRVVLINQSACRLIGVDHAQAMQRPVDELFKDIQGCEMMLERLLLPIASNSVENNGVDSIFKLRRQDGVTRDIEPRFFRIVGPGFTVNSVSMRDVTEREAAIKQLQEHTRIHAEQDMRRVMTSCVVHEIGNPLNAILGFTQLMGLDRANPLTGEQAQRLKMLSDASEHLKGLMDDLRDATLLEQGRFKVDVQRVDLFEVLNASTDHTNVAAKTAGISLHWIAPKEKLTVAADPSRLRQCLINLLSNAIKYNRPGGRVDVSVSHDSNHVVLSVSDTGEGMSEVDIARLFRPFERLNKAGSGIPGTGLGLAISKMLIEAMGGNLTVSSTPGVGSCFSISLPNQTKG